MISIPAAIVVSLFIEGIINKVRSMASGRQGPGMFQMLRDQTRLLRKGNVYSRTTTYVFQLAPMVNIAALLVGLACLPFGNWPSLISFEGDFVFFVYALALGRLLMVWAALDTGSPFQGMGANREALYGMLLEPAMFFLLGSFALLTGEYSFNTLFANVHFGDPISYLVAGLAGFILLLVLMAENGRLPVDDPRTHLELTMVHEVMVLDHSGFDLALISYGNSLKFGTFALLIANFFMGNWLPWWGNLLLYLVTAVGIGALIGLGESFRARNPMRRNPAYLLALTSLSILVFFTVLLIAHRF